MNLFKRFTTEGRQDAISPTYCAAKWFEGTIWLHKGATASCHHTPLTPIQLDKPSSIFNSPRKMADREEMLEGKRPEGCDYCWTIEDSGGVSDRRIKTKALGTKVKFYKKTELESTPVQLEIAFDRTCNLSCAYCSPNFSSKWANEVKTRPFKNLKTERRYSEVVDYIDGEDNPYIDAFYAWWPELEKTLKVLRITGGEPLMSSKFWQFIDYINTRNYKGELHINTNLVNHKGELEKLIERTKNLKIKIFTSLESNLDQAEYVRAGFNQTIWSNNVHKILSSTAWNVNVTTAVSSLTVWNYIDYLNLMVKFKETYGNNRVEITCNFVNYPVFMRVDLIPRYKRFEASLSVRLWLIEYRQRLNKHELEQVQRFIKIVGDNEQAVNDKHFKLEDTLADLKSFIKQYDQMNQTSYTCLDPKFVDWYESI